MSNLDDLLDDECCSGHCDWAEESQNKDLTKIISDPHRLKSIKKADMVSKLKYDHIDNFVNLLEKIRLMLFNMHNSSEQP